MDGTMRRAEASTTAAALVVARQSGERGASLLERSKGMPLKTYGIFLAYPPAIDLRVQGLGRYLADFLKGAAELDNVRIVIACPSWLRENLDQLFLSEHVAKEKIEILSPRQLPISLRLYQALQKKPPARKRRRLVARVFAALRHAHSTVRRRLERCFVSTRSLLMFM